MDIAAAGGPERLREIMSKAPAALRADRIEQPSAVLP